MLTPDYPVLTERLRLRPLTVADAPALATYQAREDVCRYIPYSPRTASDLVPRLKDPTLTRSTLSEPGQAMWLAAERRADGVLVGDVLLFWHSREHAGGEIGYVFDPRWHGNGYATEACETLLRLGFDELGLHRIVGRIDSRNAASAAVLRRLGMRQEAHLVQNEWFKGEWTDEVVFAMLAAEWHARRS